MGSGVWVMNMMLKKTASVLAAAFATAVLIGSGCNSSVTSGSDFLASGNTMSFFKAIQVDPKAEDTAGPQFVVADDLDGDGRTDVVSAWNQSQPVQIHLQRVNSAGDTIFETVTLASSVPVVTVSGLAVADFDQDGHSDIAVMLKSTLGSQSGCLDSENPTAEGLNGLIMVYLGPSDSSKVNQALSWTEVPLEASRLQGKGDASALPEQGGFSSMKMGDIDLDGDMDLVVAWNSSCNNDNTADVVLFTNLGGAAVRDRTWTGAKIPDAVAHGDLIKDVALGDVDGDGDLDIVATYPDATSMNVRWFRNPTVDVPDSFHVSDGTWQTGTIGQVATSADTLQTADLDGDGNLDVLVRSSAGKVLQWFRGRGVESATLPVANIQWQVYTLAEFTNREPQAIAVTDLNGDGQNEVIAAAGGALAWFNAKTAPSVFDQWTTNLILDDDTADMGLAATDPNAAPGDLMGTTFINSICVVDLDRDGREDLLITLDRSGLSGISSDALVWLRNTN